MWRKARLRAIGHTLLLYARTAGVTIEGVVGGAETVLACFGYEPDAEQYGESCELLKL